MKQDNAIYDVHIAIFVDNVEAIQPRSTIFTEINIGCHTIHAEAQVPERNLQPLPLPSPLSPLKREEEGNENAPAALMKEEKLL